MSKTAFEGWAIVEIMGHRTRPGYVKEVEIAGGRMLRVDIPAPDADVTEFYGVASIYSIRPCSEQMARDQASTANARPVRPIQYRELPKPDAEPPAPFGFWPWDWAWWKPKTVWRDLTRAAALIVAEMGRRIRKNCADYADAVGPTQFEERGPCDGGAAELAQKRMDRRNARSTKEGDR